MMTDADAAWIRDNVWPPAMRRTFGEVPGFFVACACQYSGAECRHGDRCHRREPLTLPLGAVFQRGGEHAAIHPEPYRHPTPTATGPKRTRHAQVWYADRTCRWVCDCECHTEAGRAAVLAWLIKTGLYPEGSTEDELTPPAYRAYRAEKATRAGITASHERRERAAAEQAAAAAAADAEFRATRTRREAIREWAAEHHWPIGKGRISDAVIEAYEVDQEDGAGQGALF
ncbi:Lsr2 family protein [Actinomadura mexicana]|uniref:Lsr2 protein n=1 Tax=Actinomadura mexicana TaxID=134959 RepID=A0A239HH00_9ACTN|nr:Lsr2 family protein [Actinomadura mexicana]SNS80592.1 Lsr2 protein [Actinomadura mexicana]